MSSWWIERILAPGRRKQQVSHSLKNPVHPCCAIHMQVNLIELLRAIFVSAYAEGGWYLSYLVLAAQTEPIFTFPVVFYLGWLLKGFWSGWKAIFLSFKKSSSYARENNELELFPPKSSVLMCYFYCMTSVCLRWIHSLLSYLSWNYLSPLKS